MKPPCLAIFTLEKISKRAEKSFMLPKSSFEEILKLHMNLEKPQSVEQPKFQFRAEPFLHLDFETQETSRARFVYGVKTKAPRPKIKRTLSVMELGVIEQACLKILSPENLETLTEDSLKKLYRQRIFNAHPDRGGSSEEFLSIGDAYQTIAQVFKL